MDQMFLFVSSEDCKTVFPGNNSAGFTIQLPGIIDLKGTWVCALSEIYLDNKFVNTPNQIVVSSDLIEDSYISDTQWPVLRRIPVVTNQDIDLTFAEPYYFKIVQHQAHRIHLYLRDQDLQPVQFTSGQLSCVLHLKRIA